MLLYLVFRLVEETASSGVGSVKLGKVAEGYSVSSNSAVSETFSRVFVDGPVHWVVKVGDVIAVFQRYGRDHWFREVSGRHHFFKKIK